MLFRMFLEMKNQAMVDIENLCRQTVILLAVVNPAQANAELCNLIASTLIDCGLNKDQFTINVKQ